MAAQVGVGLLARQDQEVGVGVAAAALEVGLQLLQPERAGVVRVAVAVEVEDVGDVDPQRPHHRYPRRRRVEAPGVDQLLGERRVEVGGHRLVAGQRLVAVAVGERHDRLPAGDAVVGAEVEVDRHPLLRARRGVVEREHLLDPGRVIALGALPLADAEREGLPGVPPVPDVAEVHLQLTGEEELVGRREDGDRTALAPGDGEPVACPQDVHFPASPAETSSDCGSPPDRHARGRVGACSGEKPFSPPR